MKGTPNPVIEIFNKIHFIQKSTRFPNTKSARFHNTHYEFKY